MVVMFLACCKLQCCLFVIVVVVAVVVCLFVCLFVVGVVVAGCFCCGILSQVVISGDPRRLRTDLDSLKAEAKKLRGKAHDLREQTGADFELQAAQPSWAARFSYLLSGPAAAPVALALAAHGLALLILSTGIHAAASRRHFKHALPSLVGGASIFMLLLGCSTLLVLGAQLGRWTNVSLAVAGGFFLEFVFLRGVWNNTSSSAAGGHTGLLAMLCALAALSAVAGAFGILRLGPGLKRA
ncbi:unnamed protein product [Polarella glacialis]|uniref:Uncharacterized protein n=1 Tax=Polarella glacialis TaxID=89957 RepID=A0A813GW25_POLGL|nr:unnamed protein product [Polarella glacialis]